MASNAKVRERKAKTIQRKDKAFQKVLISIDKVLSTGDLPKHYVGGGQPFTKGKDNGNK